MDLLDKIRSSKSILTIVYDDESQDLLFDALDKLLIISPVDYKFGILNEDSFDYDRRDMKISIILTHGSGEAYNIVNLDNFSMERYQGSMITFIKSRIIRKITSSGYSLSKDDLKIKTIFINKTYVSAIQHNIRNDLSYNSDLVLKLKSNQMIILKDHNLPLTV